MLTKVPNEKNPSLDRNFMETQCLRARLKLMTQITLHASSSIIYDGLLIGMGVSEARGHRFCLDYQGSTPCTRWVSDVKIMYFCAHRQSISALYKFVTL